MKKKVRYLVLAAALILVLLIPGCSLGRDNGVVITGALDMLSPFERKVAPALQEQLGIDIKTRTSKNGIDDLKEGSCDLLLLGREPEASELKGLQDHIIAYDAVCITIDANSYTGGEYWIKTNVIDPSTLALGPERYRYLDFYSWVPNQKTGGLRNLTLAEIKEILSYDIKTFTSRWEFNDFAEWDAETDLNTGTKGDFKYWMQKPRLMEINPKFIPGAYDTQTVLYKSAGLNEQEIARVWKPSQISKADSEEWVLATTYSSKGYEIGADAFSFRLSFCSRRVMPVAFQNVPLRVVTVDGIDPITDTKAIYEGTYPLSRKIHLLTRENPSTSATRALDFLLSPDGQEILQEMGYLAVP